MLKVELEDLYKKFYNIPKEQDNILTLGQKNVVYKNGQKTALFLDEISRAPQDVRQAALQLVLAKKIHEHQLPKLKDLDTVIIAADNPDDGDYQVETLDPALLDRFCVVDVELDVEDWLAYARDKKLNKIVRAFIADNPSKLHFVPNNAEDDNISATPRSWTKLCSYVNNFSNIPRDIQYNIIAGKIGKYLAGQFMGFLDNYETLISVQDVEDLTNNLLQKTNNIEEIGKGIKELISDSEVTQITEITYSLINKYIDDEYAYPLMGMLYALNIEILVSIFKKMSNENIDNYKKIVQLDVKLNNKKLFIKAAEAIVV